MIRYDYLGAAHPKFPWMKALKLTPEGSAICVLHDSDTFGSALPQIKKGLKRYSGKFLVWFVHCHWSNSHKIIPLAKLRKACKEIQKLALQYPQNIFYISHSLEYNENSAQEVKKRVDVIRELAPNCIPVNCRWKGAGTPNIVEEHHEENFSAKMDEIASTDGAGRLGTGAIDIDIEAWHQRNRKALMRGMWAPRFNLRYNQTPQPPPKKRTAIPSPQYIKSIMRLALPKSDAPKVAGARDVSKKEIWKSHADDKPGAGSRANKPVFLAPENVKVIQIKNCKGRRIGKMSNGGRDEEGHGNRFIYRLGQWGFQLAEKAMKTGGSEFVWLQVGKQLIGPIHPAFRYN